MDPANNAMAVQHGGNHYKGMKIEPFEFGHANRYDPEVFSIMKYVARHHLKNGAEDLRKAHHIVDIRMAQIRQWGMPAPSLERICVSHFITKNGINRLEGAILRELDVWARHQHDAPDRVVADIIKRLLEQLLDLTYGETV